MQPIERFVASVTEDRRAAYLFNTEIASAALNVGSNKFGEWWSRTRGKLIELYIAQPGELAAELCAMIALAEAERQRRKP